jgi:ATP-dependent Lon protease
MEDFMSSNEIDDVFNNIDENINVTVDKELENKVKDYFSEMIVLKNPLRTQFFNNLSLPSYMRDWIIMKFSDHDGNFEQGNVLSYVKKYIPSRNDYNELKYNMINGETVRFLARIRVSVNIRNGMTEFELPDFGGTRNGAGGEVAKEVTEEWKELLLKENENWGILDLVWERDFSQKKGGGKIILTGFQQFCPYTVDIDVYKSIRKKFSITEWIDILIGAVDYNPTGYDNESQKLYFLRRLLPFVQRRINLIELAPKGTGKSYVYEKISKRGWLQAAGTISRASLFYNNNTKTSGLLTNFDFIAFDEIQTMTFTNPTEIQTALKHYMEFGEVKGFDTSIVADAGIIILGNIEASKFNMDVNMVNEINPIFRESATLDRFHGFIPGWEIPRLNQSIIANGWALNTEYFAEVLHSLREELNYSKVIDDLLDIPPKADQRDLVAIKRISEGFLKLLFPQIEKANEIDSDDFLKYCLEPAKEMRNAIKKQLCIVDPGEFDIPGKRDIPDIQVK